MKLLPTRKLMSTTGSEVVLMSLSDKTKSILRLHVGDKYATDFQKKNNKR